MAAEEKQPTLSAQTAISAGYVIPAWPEGIVLKDHTIIIDGGRITALLPTELAKTMYKVETWVNRPQHAVLPGFVNTHTHSAMSLFRGLANDLPLPVWLNDHIWPLESQLIDPVFIRDGSKLALCEMIKTGTTCFHDMYFLPEVTAECVIDSGMRAHLGLVSFSNSKAQNFDEQHYLLQQRTRLMQTPTSSRIQWGLAPHSPYACSEKLLRATEELSQEFSVQVQIHLSEHAEDLEQSIQTWGMSPIARLAKLKCLNPRWMLVHMVWPTEDDWSVLREFRPHIVHCPCSNLKLACGNAPIARYLDNGLNVALGTDSAASNNSLNMMAELKTASLLAKIKHLKATDLNAATTLSIATWRGAKALGLENQIGSITIGKYADLFALNLDDIRTQPIHNPIANIVYSAQSDQITDVWVQGKCLLENRQLTTIDEREVIASAQRWPERMISSLGEDSRKLKAAHAD